MSSRYDDTGLCALQIYIYILVLEELDPIT